MEIRNIPIGTNEFKNVCNYVEININRENLSKNGGTLNYANLTYDSDILIIAYDDGKPVGYNSVVRCGENDEGYYIYQIAVKKEYQNQGIGPAMLKEIVDMADKEDTFITANVMNYNINSQKMFKSFGFIKVSEKDGDGFYIRPQKKKNMGHAI